MHQHIHYKTNPSIPTIFQISPSNFPITTLLLYKFKSQHTNLKNQHVIFIKFTYNHIPNTQTPITTPRTTITTKPNPLLCFKSQNNEKNDHINSIIGPKKIESLKKKKMKSLIIPYIITCPTPKQPLTTTFTTKPNPLLCFKSQNNERDDRVGYLNSINGPKKIESLMKKKKMESLIIPHIITYPTPKQPLTTKPNPLLCFKSQNNEKNDEGNHMNSSVGPKKIESLMIKEEEKGGEMKKRKKLVMLVLCGVGYYVQGFRCFPWLALNYHMSHCLKLHPSTLQFVQNVGNLPMVAKPIYGVLSDALYICGAHRVPYISIGVFLQVLSWGPLAMAPFVGEALPSLMACVLLSNLGAAITEVAQDALVTEYGQKHSIVGLQSYTFMAIAVAGILGNSLGGIILSKSHPRVVLFMYTTLLFAQLLICLAIKEETLDLSKPSNPHFGEESLFNSIKKQFSDLMVALNSETISRPLIWVVFSIAMVPLLTGSIFCYQTQYLNLNPSIIGMSKVMGQMMLLSLTVLYDRYWKNIPIRKLVKNVQIFYASTLLLDLVLVNRINLKLGISNDTFALLFAGLSETIAIFKNIPFVVLIGSLSPPGCEASVTAFLASVLTLSTIISGFFGIGLASLLGITSGNFTCLPSGIVVECLAALVPLLWINNLPNSPLVVEKGRKGRSKRSRRNRRVGRVVFKTDLSYRRGRESETQR